MDFLDLVFPFGFSPLVIIYDAYQTELCGWGVVAAEPIGKGDFIVEYVGEGNFMYKQNKNALNALFDICMA